MTHLRVLCKDIGPRPPASPQEKQAAAYVRQTLEKIGVKDIAEQPFKSRSSLGWVIIPMGLMEALGALLGIFGGKPGLLLGGLLLLLGAWVLYHFTRARPAPWERWVARHESQNVIATLPAVRPCGRRIVLVGHLDSNKQRFLLPPPTPAWMMTSITLLMALPTAVGLFFLAALALPETLAWLRILAGGVFLAIGVGPLAVAMWDETQPTVEGANDNASAVGVLLGIAEALQAQPLQNCDVTLLFTGCEEVGCTGIEAYLRQNRPAQDETCWIDLEMMGTGNLCYVTRHGVSHLRRYQPSARLLELAAQTSARHPELNVTGKEMLILEEVSNLRAWDYDAICIAGYDAKGYLPNWHRLSDCLENIEPETLARAAQYTWALMKTIDAV